MEKSVLTYLKCIENVGFACLIYLSTYVFLQMANYLCAIKQFECVEYTCCYDKSELGHTLPTFDLKC